jgi:hypothetical protein
LIPVWGWDCMVAWGSLKSNPGMDFVMERSVRASDGV